MGLALISFVQNHWPFTPRKLDDVKLSEQLVNRLSIPDNTKRFVFAIVEPENEAVVYILAAQNLSKQSAIDAEFLIKEVKPDVVVAQVAPSSLSEIKSEEKINKSDNEAGNAIPTSYLGVLKGCFVDKSNKDKYERLAGGVVLKEIFGVGFYGNFLAAKRVAKEVGSSFLLIESPFVRSCADDPLPPRASENSEGKNNFQGLGLKSSSLVPQTVGSGVSSSSRRLLSSTDIHPETAKSLVSALSQLNPKPSISGAASEEGKGDCHLIQNYQVPSFAQNVYSLLTDLHIVFDNLPYIGKALAHAQKMLHNVDNGEKVDTQLLSEVQTFQIAVEGMRIGLNNAGRCPIAKNENDACSKLGFSEMPTEDKSQAVFAQAIRCQTKKFKSVVAIVDASSLGGLRKHWNTCVPPEVEDLIGQFVTKYEVEGEIPDAENSDKKRLIPNKPVVAVGAGATAVLGASSLSKALPASTFMKLVTYKIPASLKLALVQTQKAVAISLGKALGPSQVLGPGILTSGAKSTSAVKAAASATKIRAVAHSVLASAERTSFSAMRTAFYEIMRKRRFQSIGYRSWIKFGCSFSACAGLLTYGDGIECAAESIPVAPSIVSLGRGLQNLHQASQVVRQADHGTKIQEAIHSLLYSLKKDKTP
ncbi:hypothetical protein IFM89_027950 [Coptis chinensis]|uniref:Uncharacterized protein n=1 Tax=Coptis chinensis TaxID=261450 RepID=A0A835IE92_9MAGN|nr:hypothetical protein IFM89_027950 [Coptis chinensis]